MLKRELDQFAESKLEPILKPLVAQVLRKKPADVVTFMIDYLNKYKMDNASLTHSRSPSASERKASRFTRRTGFSAETLTLDEMSNHTFRALPKTKDERKSIREAVAHNFLFRSLDEDQFEVVIGAMERKCFKEGDAIITQGQQGDEFFILEKGTTACYLDRYSPPKCVKNYERGDGFGELALMYSVPRQASIIVTSKECVVWALDRPTFQHVIMRGVVAQRSEYERFLPSLPLLSSLDDYDRSLLSDDLRKKSFEEGEYIIRSGDAPTASSDRFFYFLLSGHAKATKRLRPDDDEDTTVLEYECGDVFGEILLLGDANERQCNVIACDGPCEVVFLDQVSFDKCLSSVKEKLRAKQAVYKDAEDAKLAAINA